jgi:lysophospholipase L1-like esterase
LKVKLEAHFHHVINLSEGGAKLTNTITEQIEIAMRSHPGPNQVYVIMFGGNNMRQTTKPALEVAKLVSRFRRIMTEAQKAEVRVLLCGDIPDPRPAVDSKLKLLDEALEDLEMGEGNRFLALRSSMLDAQGKVRTDIYKPRGDIHLNASGTQIASLRIQQMLKVMFPIWFPLQFRLRPLQFRLRLHQSRLHLHPRNLSGPEFRLPFRIRHQLQLTNL